MKPIYLCKDCHTEVEPGYTIGSFFHAEPYAANYHTVKAVYEPSTSECMYCHRFIQYYHGMWMSPGGSTCVMSAPGLAHQPLPLKKEDQPVTNPTWEEVEAKLNLGIGTYLPVNTVNAVKTWLKPLWNTPETAPVGQVRVDGDGGKYCKIDRDLWLRIGPSRRSSGNDEVRNFRVAGNLPE
jgi:hypothetical protein